MTARRLWIQVALLFAVLYVALLGVRPLITPDEPRYGAMAADMLASGQWLKLRMAGFTYYEKPPMGVWLIAASEAVFGHNAFAVRLPGALASLVSALCAGMVARRVSGRAEAAPLAALVQLTTVFPMVIGTFAVLDPIFTGEDLMPRASDEPDAAPSRPISCANPVSDGWSRPLAMSALKSAIAAVNAAAETP